MTPLLIHDTDEGAPALGMHAVSADPALLGYIGGDHKFYLLAPVFATADGPKVS
jgi:hypothetical protein